MSSVFLRQVGFGGISRPGNKAGALPSRAPSAPTGHDATPGEQLNRVNGFSLLQPDRGSSGPDGIPRVAKSTAPGSLALLQGHHEGAGLWRSCESALSSVFFLVVGLADVKFSFYAFNSFGEEGLGRVAHHVDSVGVFL